MALSCLAVLTWSVNLVASVDLNAQTIGALQTEGQGEAVLALTGDGFAVGTVGTDVFAFGRNADISEIAVAGISVSRPGPVHPTTTRPPHPTTTRPPHTSSTAAPTTTAPVTYDSSVNDDSSVHYDNEGSAYHNHGSGYHYDGSCFDDDGSGDDDDGWGWGSSGVGAVEAGRFGGEHCGGGGDWYHFLVYGGDLYRVADRPEGESGFLGGVWGGVGGEREGVCFPVVSGGGDD